MTETITGLNIRSQLYGTVTKVGADGTSAVDTLDAVNGGFGLMPSDYTILYHTQISVAASGNTVLNLKSLTDALGVATAFATVYGFQIKNINTVTGQFVNVGAASNPFSSWNDGAATTTVKVNPNGVFLLTCATDGYAVVATTGMNLEIANPGGTIVVVQVAIIGK